MSDIDLEELNRIDEVSNLIKKLTEDNGDTDSTYNEIDNFLSRSNNGSKSFNKTLINKSNNSIQGTTKDGFFKDIERDANERAERKIQSRARAEVLKSKANEYFKAHDYDKAINYYSRAIKECNDIEVLYTNRAQAYIKIDKFKDALCDCETALKISPQNHKALLHMGRSLVRLNRFDEAVKCYETVLEIAPNLKKYMEEFFDEARKLKRNLELKQISIKTFDKKNISENDIVGGILDKLASNKNECAEYYVGGLEFLLQIFNDQSHKIDQLRNDMKDKKRIFDNTTEIQKRLKNIHSKDIEKINEIEWNLLSLWMQMLKRIMKDDESDSLDLFNDQSTITCLNFCCKSTTHIPFTLLSPTIFLLYYISNIDVGLQQIFDKFTVHSIFSITLAAIHKDQKKELVTIGMALFHNLVKSHRFKVALGKDEELVISVINCVHAIFLASLDRDTQDLLTVISIIELLAENSTIRVRLIKHEKFLDDCLKAVETRLTIHDDEKHSMILLQLFTMIHNLLVRSKNSLTGDRVKGLCNRLVTASTYLLSNHPTAEMRSILMQVLSQMLVMLPEDKLKSWCQFQPVHSSTDNDNVSMCRSLSRQSSLTDISYLDKVCKPLKLCITILDAQNHPLLPNAVKILTLASKVNQAVRFLCCDVRERALKLQSLLYKEKEELDEVLSGNICLLFINCVAETPLAEHLSNTAIIKDLLRICADANKTDCKRNAAIFAGNLAQSNHLHRTELSRLNGFNIISKFNNWS